MVVVWVGCGVKEGGGGGGELVDARGEGEVDWRVVAGEAAETARWWVEGRRSRGMDLEWAVVVVIVEGKSSTHLDVRTSDSSGCLCACSCSRTFS